MEPPLARPPLTIYRSILYQRGIYDPESFQAVKKYGLQMQVTTDPGLSSYLGSVMTQLEGGSTPACSSNLDFYRNRLNMFVPDGFLRFRSHPALAPFFVVLPDWLKAGQVKRLVVVISAVATEEVMERWTFHVHTDEDSLRPDGGPPKHKDEKEIQREIAAIIRQITSSVSFLPLLEEQCSFDLLVYTSMECEGKPCCGPVVFADICQVFGEIHWGWLRFLAFRLRAQCLGLGKRVTPSTSPSRTRSASAPSPRRCIGWTPVWRTRRTTSMRNKPRVRAFVSSGRIGAVATELLDQLAARAPLPADDSRTRRWASR